MAYAADYHVCDYPDNVYDCKGKSETVVGFKCPSPDELPPNAVARKFLPYPRFPLPGTLTNNWSTFSFLYVVRLINHWIIFALCISGDDYAYIVCVGLQPRIQYCGDGTVFDPQVLTCVYLDAPVHAGPPHLGGPGFGPGFGRWFSNTEYFSWKKTFVFDRELTHYYIQKREMFCCCSLCCLLIIFIFKLFNKES